MKKRSLIVLIGILLCFLLALNGLSRGHRAEGARQLEEAVRRSAVSCFAAEGFYPPSVAYMVEHYALRYDEKTYTVRYEVFASNLMPEITVLEK